MGAQPRQSPVDNREIDSLAGHRRNRELVKLASTAQGHRGTICEYLWYPYILPIS